MNLWPLDAWLADLRRTRPVFHSEADFQHALAWTAHESDPGLRVRLETRPEPGVRLDLLLSRPDLGSHFVIELKYLTRSWSGEVDTERFDLMNQGAQDIRAYDVVKDLSRVERFVDDREHWSGAVLVLTNEPSYWTRPRHGRPTNADAFRIHEGNQITGERAWGSLTGIGTMKGREASLPVAGTYLCSWSDYSELPGRGGKFRLLKLTVFALSATRSSATTTPGG